MFKKVWATEFGLGRHKISAGTLTSHNLFTGSAIMIGGSMGVNVLNYAYHLVMGRMLGPTSYGDLASLFSILYIISIIPLSASFAIVKFISVARNKKERGEVFHGLKKLINILAVSGTLIIVLLSPFINNFLHLNSLSSVLLVAPTFLFMLLALINKAAVQGILKFFGVVFPEFVISAAKLLLGILFVYLGYSVAGAMGAVFIGSILAYIASGYFIDKESFPISKKKYDLKPFLKYSFPVLIQALAFTSLFTMDIILVKHFLPPFQAGIYAALATLGKIIYFAAQPVTSVMFPIVSGKRSRGEAYRKIFYLSVIATAAISGFVVFFYKFFPKFTIGTLYGDDYLSATNALFWMGLFVALYTLSNLFVNFLLSIHKTSVVVLPLIAAVIQITAIYIWHEGILQIIQVNVGIVSILLFGLVVYMGYNQLRLNHAKR